MTPSDYKRAKSAGGLLTMARLNEDTIAISCRRFDPVTGQELDPQAEQFNLREVKAQLVNAELGVALLKEFVTDIEAVPVMKPGG